MRLSACAAVVLVLLLAVPLILSGSRATANPPSPLGGFVDSIRFIEQPNQGQALIDLRSGAMDLYTFPLRTVSDIQIAHTDPDLRTADEYGGENNLFVNPVPVDQAQAPGVFNPFAIREVREALNYLVDRNYLNDLLFGGYGTTHATLWNNASPEVARDPFFFADANRAASHDFDRARTMIFDALTAAGATYNGTWSWQGNPIVIQFIIRVEDVRRNLGNYVADQLERVGLTVSRDYYAGSQAFSIVYNGPPDTGAWMLYTEGWQTTLLQRWPDANLDFFDCGGEGSALWAYYSPPAALQSVCTALLNAQYSSEAQRQQLIETGVTLALNNSVRVWILGGMTQVYSARVTAVAADAASGLWSPFTLRTARFASPGGTLTVGQRLQFLSPFQPWQGLGWFYDKQIGDTIMDPGLTTHPRTGEYIPVRSEFAATTAGPNGTMSLPSDALTWDPTTMGFTPVTPGTTSTSKVTFHYTFGTWHDGTTMSMNDVLYNIALIVRRNRGDVAIHDSDALNPHDLAFTNLFRGLKVIDATTLDVYVDYWHLDPSFIATTADVWPTTPWEVGELAMATTLHDHTRVSEVTAANEALSPIDLTFGPAFDFMDRELSDGNITTSGAGVSRPPGLESYISQTEAEARWLGLQAWRASHNNYFVSNGPYYLDSKDDITVQAILTNFASYPFPADRWDGLTRAPVPALTIEPIDNVVAGQEGRVNLTTTVNSVPYDTATIHYRIRPQTNTTTIVTGLAVHVGPGAWQVTLDPALTSNLTLGAYLFQAAANGNETSVVVFADQAFFVTSGQTDTTAPTSSIDALPSYWQPAGPLHVDVAAADDLSGVFSVALYVAFSADGTTWSTPSSVATDGTAPFAFDYALAQGNGRYRLWSLATDGAGNSEALSGKPATGDLEVGLDTARPGASLASLPSYWQSVLPISLQTISSEATSGVAMVDLYTSYSADGATWTSPTKVATATTSPFSFVYTPAQDGRYRLWALATDRAGNADSMASQAPTGQVTLGVDRIAPTATVVAPAPYWRQSGPFSMDVIGSDAVSGVGFVTVIVSYSADGVTWSTADLAATDSAVPFHFSYTPTHGDGRYRFWAVAIDQAGNVEPASSLSPTGEAEIGLDSVAPSILSVAPTKGATEVSEDTTIRVTFSESVGHAAAESAFSISPSVSGTFSWDGNTLIFTPSLALAKGTSYQVTIQHTGVTDAAGNGLAADYAADFKTAAAPATPLGILGGWTWAVAVVAVILILVGIGVWVRSRRKP